MSGPPPTDLMQWPKGELAKEVARLRVILREHSEQLADEPTSGGSIVDVAGDPHARGGVVLDTRRAVLMDSLDVALIDTRRDEQLAMLMVLEGRVNMDTRRTSQAFMFGADGAAGLVSQLMGLASRAGGAFAEEFLALLDARMKEMP